MVWMTRVRLVKCISVELPWRLYENMMKGTINEATILTEKGGGESDFIPLIALIPANLPFNFNRF